MNEKLKVCHRESALMIDVSEKERYRESFRDAWHLLFLGCAHPTSRFHFSKSLFERVAEAALTAAIGQLTPTLMIPSSSLDFSLLEGHSCWSKCGRRTRPFSGRAFREHMANVSVLPSHSHLQDGFGATNTSTSRRWSV